MVFFLGGGTKQHLERFTVPPVKVFPTMPCANIHLDINLTRRTSGFSFGIFKGSSAVADIGELLTEKYFCIQSSNN
jgi:hypothetical protein